MPDVSAFLRPTTDPLVMAGPIFLTTFGLLAGRNAFFVKKAFRRVNSPTCCRLMAAEMPWGGGGDIKTAAETGFSWMKRSTTTQPIECPITTTLPLTLYTTDFTSAT